MDSTKMRKTVNVAVVGCGFMGKEHSKAYSLAPVSCPDIAATPIKKILCDAVPGVAEEKAHLWGFEEYTTDYHEILERDDIDIIDICTPAPYHLQISMDAIKAGKFVVCEKPLVLTMEEADQLYAVVKEYNGRTATCFNKRKWPAVQFARDLIKEGTIGTPLLYSGRYFQDALYPFSHRSVKSYGGGYADAGSHIIDMCTYILDDKYDSIVARAYPLVPEQKPGDTTKTNDEECFAMVMAQMKSGVTASLFQTYAYSGTGEDISFEVIGTQGSMRWDGANPSIFQLSINGDQKMDGFRNIVLGAEHPFGDRVPPLPGFGVGVADNMAFQACDIINAYCGGYAYTPSFEDAWEVIKICDDIRLSEKTKAWVKVQ